jgi:hypothetical protein
MKGVWFTELKVDPNDFKWEENNPEYVCNICQKNFNSGYKKSSIQLHVNSKMHKDAKKEVSVPKKEEDPLRKIINKRVREEAKRCVRLDEYMNNFLETPLGKEMVKERMLKKLKEKSY